MCRKKGKRRNYVNVDSLRNRFVMLDDKQRDSLGFAYHSGLLLLERGIGTDEDWGTIATCISLGIDFALKGNGADDFPCLLAAQKAVMACEERFKLTGKYIFSGDELKCVHAGLTAHDKQMARTSCHTVSKLLVSMEAELKTDV